MPKLKNSCNKIFKKSLVSKFLFASIIVSSLILSSSSSFARLNYLVDDGHMPIMIPEDGGGGGGGGDSTPPSKPMVYDDGKYTRSATQLHATWSSNDPESGVTEYKCGVGTSPGLVNVVNWTSVGLTNEATGSGLNLIDGQCYYVTVIAKNGCGLWSTAGNSDGIIVDTQPPQGTIVINNGARYTNSVSITLTLSAYDSGSGINKWAKMKFSTDNLNWSLPEAYATTKSGTLTDSVGKKTIYVKFRDVAGNWSGVFSDTVFLIREPPRPQ